MYRGVRNVHLCAGAFSLVFLLLYLISAIQMTHRTWLPLRPRTATQHLVLTPGLAGARPVARELAARFSISGELSAISQKPDTLDLRIQRPGTVWQVSYNPATGDSLIQTTGTGLLGALTRIHRMNGVWHDWGPYNAWSVLLAIAGAALLTLGLTGLYLWWKAHRDIRLSGAIFALAIAFAGGLAAWMRIN